MSRALNVEFHEMDSGAGIVDIAIRYDVKTGSYNFLLEENGLPTTVPMHVFTGILFNLASEATRGVIAGYSPDPD